MARIPRPPARETIAPAELGAFDAIEAIVAARADSTPTTYTSAMLHTPVIGAAVRELGRALRLAPLASRTFTYVDFELVVHALGVDAGFLEHHHILDALAQGVRVEALEAILRGRLDELTEEERQIVEFARRTVARTLGDADWEAVARRRGERGVIELGIVVGFVWTTLLWQRAWHADGASVAEIGQLLQRHREGTLELPDPRTAIRAR